MDVTLLGPQRIHTAARAAVHELIPHGPIATVNAGWEERESDDAELNDVLGDRMLNLRLYQRRKDVHERDPEYAAGERRLDDLQDELQTFYALRLHHALAAIDAVCRRREVPSVQEEALSDAIRSVQALDDWHLTAVRETRREFRAAFKPGERDSIIGHRQEVARLVGECTGMVFTGGHVGVILRTLRLFDLEPLIRVPLIAWSAGAMALAERVVLYNDMAPEGSGHAEVYAEGLAAYSGVMVFPHARRRLRLNDDAHLGLMARRFAPRSCLLLADGERVDLRDGEPLPPGARVLVADGGIATVEVAA